MNFERALKLVKAYTAAGDLKTQTAVAQRMITHGECVWHAASVVTGKPCGCHDCRR